VLEVHTRPDAEHKTALLVTSNLSISLTRLFLIFAVLSVITLGIAVALAFWGFWPILIFAFVHLFAVGWCFRLAWRGNWARQRILIGPDTMTVEETALKHHQRVEWPTPWVRVEIRRSRGEPRVYLTQSGESIEVGAFLPPAERWELAEALRQGLGPYSAWSDKHHSLR